MNKLFIAVTFAFASATFAQTVEERLVDIVYGDKVIRGTYQVVIDDEYEADVIPFDQQDVENKIPSNVVISSGDEQLSYIETQKLAEREAEIYSEVNRRTENAPYTILFAGRIPEHIQKERMKMMPEVGIFGQQRAKLNNNQGDLEVSSPNTGIDAGEFLPIETSSKKVSTSKAEAMLEEMISR
ncbi:hypothetical protein CBF23_000890 [Marinomonas agarivorans]|nr:hypothetical protein CBF23_000890 [Marinomonas agarivorans]